MATKFVVKKSKTEDETWLITRITSKGGVTSVVPFRKEYSARRAKEAAKYLNMQADADESAGLGAFSGILDNATPADIILQQLGGRRFLVMTGAKASRDGENTLHLQFPSGKVKTLTIELMPADTYTLKAYGPWRAGKRKTLHESDDVYAENLRSIVSDWTGLALSL